MTERDRAGGSVARWRERRPVPSQRRVVRWRSRAWRHRHLIAATAVALAGWTVVSEVRPPPPATDPVLVLRRELPAGATLSAADVDVVDIARPIAPEHALREPGDVLGARLAVGLPPGQPLTEHLLAGPGLASGAPDGHAVVPVRLADDAVAGLLRAGDEIDLLSTAADEAGSAGAARVVASAALVVSVHGSGGSGLLGTETADPLVLVAIHRDAVDATVGANAWAPLRVSIPP